MTRKNLLTVGLSFLALIGIGKKAESNSDTQVIEEVVPISSAEEALLKMQKNIMDKFKILLRI